MDRSSCAAIGNDACQARRLGLGCLPVPAAGWAMGLDPDALCAGRWTAKARRGARGCREVAIAGTVYRARNRPPPFAAGSLARQLEVYTEEVNRKKLADSAIEKRIKNDELANLATPDLQTKTRTGSN